MLRKTFYLAKQGFTRKKFRTWVMILSIALACSALFLAAVLNKGVQDTISTARERLGADLVVVPGEAREEAESAIISGNPTAFYMPRALEEQVGRIRGVKLTSPQMYLRSLDAPCCVAQVALVGIDSQSDFTVTPWLLQKNGESLRDNQIIVGAKVISAVVGIPAQAIGMRLVFMGKPFSVASILEPTGLGTDYTVFINMNVAYQMTQDSPLYPVPVKKEQISTIMVKLEDDFDSETVAQDIRQSVPGVEALTAGQLTRSLSRQLQGLADIVRMVGWSLALLAIILVGILFTLSVRQRMREFGLFGAMGASRSMIFRLILLESILIAGTGGLAGVMLGYLTAYFGRDMFTAMIGNLYNWPGHPYFLAVAAVILGGALLAGILGGVYPAASISCLEPYNAIRRGISR